MRAVCDGAEWRQGRCVALSLLWPEAALLRRLAVLLPDLRGLRVRLPDGTSRLPPLGLHHLLGLEVHGVLRGPLDLASLGGLRILCLAHVELGRQPCLYLPSTLQTLHVAGGLCFMIIPSGVREARLHHTGPRVQPVAVEQPSRLRRLLLRNCSTV